MFYIFISIYLLLENRKNSNIIKEIIDFKSKFDYNNNNFKNEYPNDDIDMIGLKKPKINYDKIKESLVNYNIIESLIDLINQLEIKLIYLEKEIDITKLVSFYTSRKIYNKEKNISYDDANVTQLHELVNWIIIHQSNQLKGIAADKYLACKYVKLKLGKNLCPQRILAYDNFDDLKYKELSKYGNIILKFSNSCTKSMNIPSNINETYFNKKLQEFKQLLQYKHGLVDAQYFHLYAKKRIIVEKVFSPLTELFEFRFFLLNNKIKFIIVDYIINGKYLFLFYDANYNFIFDRDKYNITLVNITSTFSKEILNTLKNYSIKLSEDFHNFIRVDLYVFHNKIYFSELTFASFFGLPMNKDEKLIKDAMKNFSLIEDYY